MRGEEVKTHQNLWVYAEDEESGQLKEQRKQVTATELKEEGNRLLKEGQLEEAHLLWSADMATLA